MTTLPENIIEKLIQIEAGIHYFESPKPGQMPFVVIERESPVILSAPHGAMAFRNNHFQFLSLSFWMMWKLYPSNSNFQRQCETTVLYCR
jgi:hypothetical protein